nr:FimV/HubP family polar landmark protein [Burkholderiaceae bacterium]
EGYRGNTFFGATGGQSVDTGATSVFNSSFIPAASQLDSNEVDPVAEADVYIAYGREEQAEDILKEALRTQPDRHGVRVKLLEIYSRRGDTASFADAFEELRVRTGALGDEWERAVKLGRSLDPNNPAYADAAHSAAEAAARGPTTELRLNPSTRGRAATVSRTGVAAGTAAGLPADADFDRAVGSEADSRFGQAGAPSSQFGVDSKMDTAMPTDTHTHLDTHQDFGPEASEGPPSRFEATLGELSPSGYSQGSEPAAEKQDQLSASTTGIDFGSLDFDLGSTKIDAPTSSTQASPPTFGGFELPSDLAASSNVGAQTRQPSAGKPSSSFSSQGAIPDVDLSLPDAPAVTSAAPAAGGVALEEALSRPSLLGEVGALPGEQGPRLTSNTDQATVPLIDFDLSGSDVELAGRRTEAQIGSELAGQMATKLDLARGYIDLGVKDGARELLEEVMREGTRDQRESAVELLKQVEA